MNSVQSGRGAGRSTKSDVISPFAKRAPTPAFKGLNERTWFLSMCLLGRSVTVKTTDGYSYKGMFYGMKETEQGEMHLILSHASRNDEKDAIPYAIIPYNIFASLSAEEVDLAGQDISATPFSAVAGFEDTANAFDNAGNERKLEAFVFDGNVADPGLEDAQKVSTTGGWSGNDMFAENERRFGVTATFEESMYTTGLDGANISAEEAERLAKSILAEQGATAHEREERGQADDSGLTEEDKYGAVMRQPATRSGGPPPRPPGAPPAAPPPGPPPPEDSAEQSPSALPPPGPPPPAAAGGGSNGAARSERQEINAVRLKLAEGKSLQTAVDPQLRTKYMNDAPAVDALNLMPGTGSHKFRKDKNAGMAHRLNDYKYKRQSSNSSSKPPAAGLPGGEAAAAADGAAPPPPAAPAAPAAGDAAAAGDGKPSTTMKFNPDATPFSFNPKSAPFTPGKKAQDGPSSGNEGSGGGWGGRKPWQRERGDGVRGGRGRHGRSHDGFHGPHGSGRQGAGFMYQGHMGMQGMPSMPNMIVSQPIPTGPRGAPIGQMPGGGYSPVPLHFGMPIHFNPQMAPMSQPVHPMPMNIGTGGYPMQPGMQPGYTPQSAQSPPTGYAPPNV